MPDAVPLTRIDGVELIRTGAWKVSTGDWNVGPDDLAAAVGALACPAVRNPILKLGHVDPRFNDPDGPTYDGQPALGWVDNLRIGDGGHTLLGDYAGVPGWLGTVMASAYPDRSVEGTYDYRCQVGHTHPFVLTAVALLGVTPPGVGTLQSLQDVAALYGVAASPGGVKVAATVPGGPVAAGSREGGAEHLRRYWLAGKGAAAIRWNTPGDFTRCVRQMRKHAPTLTDPEGYCAELHHTATGMWPGDKRNPGMKTAASTEEGALPSPQPSHADLVRNAWNATAPHAQWIVEVGDDEVIVMDDTTRALTRIPVTVAAGQVTFGPAVAVRMAYVPAAEPAEAVRAVFASRAESRPDPVTAPPDPRPPAAPIPPAGPPPDPDDTPTTPPDPGGVSASPGAEPEPTNPSTTEDNVSDLSVEFARGLGLPDTASRDEILAALAAVRKPTEPEPPADPESPVSPVPNPAPDRPGVPRPNQAAGLDQPVQPGQPQPSQPGQPTQPNPTQPPQPQPGRAGETAGVLVNATAGYEVYASELRRLSSELAAIKEREARQIKASLFDATVKAGKIAPADRAAWEARYDKAPEVVADVLASIADGTAVPVNVAGYTGGDDEEGSDAEFEAIMSRLDAPTYTADKGA